MPIVDSKLESVLKGRILSIENMVFPEICEFSDIVAERFTSKITKDFTNDKFTDWEDFYKAIRTLYKDLGCWGLRGKVGRIKMYVVGGISSKRVYMICFGSLESDEKELVMKRLNCRLEFIEDNLIRCQW